MPLQKLQFRPGLNREGTDYSNEGGWYDGNKVRFRSGFPEKLGGWTRVTNDTYLGLARNLWCWIDLDGANYVVTGTNIKYYINYGGEFFDVTPIIFTSDPALSGPFTTVSTTLAAGISASDTTLTVASGANIPDTGCLLIGTEDIYYSSVSGTTISGLIRGCNGTTAASHSLGATVYTPIIVVTDNEYHPSVGDYVTYSGSTSLGGNITAGVLDQEYIVTGSPSATTYTISARTAGTGVEVVSPVFANASDTGHGGTVTAEYQYPVGLNAYSFGTGWGTGPYSRGGWGSGYTSGVGTQLRLWTSDNYGEDLVIAPRGGPLYYWKDSTTVYTRAQSLADLSDAAGFDGRFVPNTTNQVSASSIQRFVIAMGANPYDPTDSETDFDPMLVRWSDQENPYEWVPAATNQSGEFRLSSGSFIMTSRNTRQEILVWTDACLYSMQYLGPPYIWGFQILMDNISIISPNAAITVNNVTYWMGTDKFYMYSGRVETLPCSLRQFIFEDINETQAFQVFAGSNEGYNEVWWLYVSNDSANNTVDKYVIYNYLDRVWYYGTLSRTAWLDTGIRPYPMAALGYSAARFVASISGTVMTVTEMLSGQIDLNAIVQGFGVTEGTSIASYGTGTGGIGTYNINNSQTVAQTVMNMPEGGLLLYHESAVDDVAGPTARPISAYVQSSDFDIGDGHNFGFVWRILPDVNFNGSNANQPTVYMTVKPRENSGTPYGTADTPAVQSQDNYTSRGVYTIQEFDGQVYTRLRGRQLSFRIESDGLGVAWQLGTPRIDIRNDGRR